MRAKNTISIRTEFSSRFIKCFRLSGNEIYTRQRERERERTRGREKKERKKEIQGLQHPLSPASKRRQKGRRAGFLRRPEARPYLACVNRNPYLCLSSTSTSVTPRHGGPRRGNRTKGKREGREGGGGLGARIFVHRHPLCNKCLGPGRRCCCLFASTNFLRGLYGENL